MSEICWKMGYRSRLPFRNRLLTEFPGANVIQCCGAAVGKGKEIWRFEGRGGRQNIKVQMTNGNELVGCITLIGLIG
jgi:hypothetical protein